MLTNMNVSYLACKFFILQTWHVSLHFTDQKIMENWDPIKLNFEDLEMQK